MYGPLDFWLDQACGLLQLAWYALFIKRPRGIETKQNPGTRCPLPVLVLEEKYLR